MQTVRMTNTIQRVEAGGVAALAVVAIVALYPAWWWMILAAFLLFDLSMVGYLRSAKSGAATYNAVHNYAAPAMVAIAAFVTQNWSPTASMTLGILACAWAFHVGVDRALGYGLKTPEGFTHTHLGRIGSDAARSRTRR